MIATAPQITNARVVFKLCSSLITTSTCYHASKT